MSKIIMSKVIDTVSLLPENYLQRTNRVVVAAEVEVDCTMLVNNYAKDFKEQVIDKQGV